MNPDDLLPDDTIETTGHHGPSGVILSVVARGAIIFATVIGLPVAAWMMNRAVESVDRISTKVDSLREQSLETNGTVKLIQQSQDVQNRILADHEARMRLLESYNRSGGIRN
jgi:hypothetical protein